MEKIYEPTDIIYNLSYLYQENALMNFVDANIVVEREVFLNKIKNYP